jgi:hypothetical protein
MYALPRGSRGRPTGAAAQNPNSQFRVVAKYSSEMNYMRNVAACATPVIGTRCSIALQTKV